MARSYHVPFYRCDCKHIAPVAALAPGTEIIFGISFHNILMDAEAQKVLAVAMAATQARGEVLQTFFEPASLADQVRAERPVGFEPLTC